MRSEKITFAGSQGEPLAARLDLPDGAVRDCALFAHCFTCSKDTLAAARIAVALAEKGIAVLRFDFTDIGESQGDFAETNFSSNLDEVIRYSIEFQILGNSVDAMTFGDCGEVTIYVRNLFLYRGWK